jgi:hypothetical protein
VKELTSRSPTSAGHQYPSAFHGFLLKLRDRATDLYTILNNAMNRWPRMTAKHSNLQKMKTSGPQKTPSSLSQRFLLLCISQWKGYFKTRMIPVNLDLDSDEELFLMLRAEYIRMIGPWRRFISLRCLKDIRFVQVS